MTKTAVRKKEVAVAAPRDDMPDGRTRILAAALDVFSTSGFEGASLRRIADRAGVQHQLVVYHFKTKDALWKAAVSSFFEENVEAMRARLARPHAEGPAAALRRLVREFVHFTARRPEYHRIATFEGRTDSPRLRWLLKEHVKPFYDLSIEFIRASQEAGATRAGDPGQIHYAMIGLVTTSFVFGPEYRVMTGIDAFAPEEIEKVIALTCDFLGVAEPRGREAA